MKYSTLLDAVNKNLAASKGSQKGVNPLESSICVDTRRDIDRDPGPHAMRVCFVSRKILAHTEPGFVCVNVGNAQKNGPVILRPLTLRLRQPLQMGAVDPSQVAVCEVLVCAEAPTVVGQILLVRTGKSTSVVVLGRASRIVTTIGFGHLADFAPD